MSVTLETGLPLVTEVLAEMRDYKFDTTTHHIGGSVGITGKGNDIDVIVLVQDDLSDVVEVLQDVWSLCGEESYESQGMFAAFRVGDVNVIVVNDEVYYDNWLAALEVCTWLHSNGTTGRDVRVAMHQIIVDGGLRD